MARERWRPVVGAERWKVSDRGRVRGPRGGILSQWVSPKGYHRVPVAGRPRAVHQLVLEAFVGPRPFPEAESRHLDGNSHRNYATNLEWSTHAENNRDRVRHGTHNNLVRTRCRRRGHLLVEPNNTPWHRRHGYRKCQACHLASSMASYFRRVGKPFDQDAYADAVYERLMAGRQVA